MTKEVDWETVDREIGREAANNLAQWRRKVKRATLGLDIAAFVLFAALLLLLSCVGCGTTLAPEGPYHGDTFLFNSDKVLVDSKDDLGGFLKWEMLNRKALSDNKLQSITDAADAIRTNAPLWFKLAYDARNNYSNAVALHQSNVAQTSNSLLQAVTSLQTQTLAARAITNSVLKIK